MYVLVHIDNDGRDSTPLKSQKAVIAYLKNQQLLSLNCLFHGGMYEALHYGNVARNNILSEINIILKMRACLSCLA